MNRSLVTGQVSAFSLVEVVLALGVTTFCLIALVGLLSVGLTHNRGTLEQAGATAVLSAAVSDLYATPRTAPPGKAASSVQFNITIPANPVAAATPVTTLYFSGTGQWSTAIQAGSAYRLTVTPIVSSAPGTTSPTRMATMMDLKATWPAAATIANASGTAEMFVGLNRN
jgi:uncharacterized protein (TIGR02598 family)